MRSRSMFKAFMMVTSLAMLGACSTTERLVKTAVIKPSKAKSSGVAMAPMVEYGASAGFGSGGVHTVLPGDNLSSIAWRYHLEPEDIIGLNQLGAPDRLSVGMRLKLPPPQTYRVKPGDTIPLIAQVFSVAQRDLVAINNISSSYRLNVGQNLKLPRPVMEALPTVIAQAQPAVWEPVSSPRASSDVVVGQALPSNVSHQKGGGGMMAAPARKPSVQQASLPAQELSLPPRGNGPFLKPVNGAIISRFGPKSGGLYNEGVNIAAARGTPVRAADAGRVVYVGSAVEGYGNLILVKHEGGYITAYAHLDKTLIKEGQVVKRGHTIGTVGSTGNVERAQLHFEIRKGRESVDPTTMI